MSLWFLSACVLCVCRICEKAHRLLGVTVIELVLFERRWIQEQRRNQEWSLCGSWWHGTCYGLRMLHVPCHTVSCIHIRLFQARGAWSQRAVRHGQQVRNGKKFMSLALLEGREQLWRQRERSHLLSDTVTGICVANPALNFYFFNETLSPLSLSTLPKKHHSNFDFFMDAHQFLYDFTHS